jgi:hypothetical protein
LVAVNLLIWAVYKTDSYMTHAGEWGIVTGYQSVHVLYFFIVHRMQQSAQEDAESKLRI